MNTYEIESMDWVAFDQGKRDWYLSQDIGASIPNPYDPATRAFESWERGYTHEQL